MWCLFYKKLRIYTALSPKSPWVWGWKTSDILAPIQLFLAMSGCVTLSSGSETRNPRRLEKNPHIHIKISCLIFRALLPGNPVSWEGNGSSGLRLQWSFLWFRGFRYHQSPLIGLTALESMVIFPVTFHSSVFVEALINVIHWVLVIQEGRSWLLYDFPVPQWQPWRFLPGISGFHFCLSGVPVENLGRISMGRLILFSFPSSPSVSFPRVPPSKKM